MTIETKENNDEDNRSTRVSQIRRIAPQFFATTVVNLLTIDAGLVFALPGIVIPALTGIQNEHNTAEFLKITAVQASWMGSIGYMVQPFGCFLSTFITDPLGRKMSMIMVNVPFAIGWYMLYTANNTTTVFCAFSILGMAIGLREAAVISYIAEICEPKTRGILNAYSNVMETLGMLVIYILNTLMPWRTAALLCLFLPLVSMVMLCFIPETPQWLLSKNRVDAACRSLCWLRGWITSKQSVSQEFNELKRHSERSKSCDACFQQQIDCSHTQSQTLSEKMRELKRKRTLKPFIIIISLSLMAQFSGINAMRSFLVQIFQAYKSPIDPHEATAILSVVDNVGIVTFMVLIYFCGKRKLYICMAFGIFLTAAVTTVYGFIYLPSGAISFDQKIESIQFDNEYFRFIPMICLFLWSFFSYCAVIAMPWVLLAELFSFKARGVMVGLTAALSYVFGFISRKTYYNLETSLSLPGSALFFCLVSGIGVVWLYLILPETENRSLEEIELHFSDNSKKITDHYIAKMTAADKIEDAKDKENLIK